VFIPPHKQSPPQYRARTIEIDSCRLCIKYSECAHNPVPTNTTHCMSHSSCKNETNTHSVSSGRCFQFSKCAHCLAPTFTHKQTHRVWPARSLSANCHKGVGRCQATHLEILSKNTIFLVLLIYRNFNVSCSVLLCVFFSYFLEQHFGQPRLILNVLYKFTQKFVLLVFHEWDPLCACAWRNRFHKFVYLVFYLNIFSKVI